MSPSNHLFRFTSVRPSETVQAEEEPLGFIRPANPANPLTELQIAVFNAGSQSAAEATAEDFIRSDLYLRGWVLSDPVQRHLAELQELLTDGLKDVPFKKLKERLKKLTDREEMPQRLTAIRNLFWDSLISAFISPRTAPHDRRGQIDALRTLHLLLYIDRIDSPQAMQRAIRATPLIPSWARKGRSAQPLLPGSPSHPAPTGDLELPDHLPDKLDTINSLRRELRQGDDARRDLEAAYWAVARERESSPSPAARVRSGPVAGEGPQLSAVADIGVAPWKNSQAISERVEVSTAQQLDRLDPHWRTSSYSEVAQLIDQHQSGILKDLLSLGGPQAARKLDTQQDLDAGDLDLDDNPWFPRNEDDFTNLLDSVGSVRPIGIGDLLIVQEKLLRYEETGVAYIENVLQSENKERIHRRLDREVETVVTSTEETEETERDLQASERYELSTEIERTLESNQSLETGISTSASYGPVLSIDASADFAVDSSSTTSTKSSSDYAQEVVDSSVSRLSRKIKESITLKTISEVEETSTHGFDNRSGSGHVIGVYRWIDKVLQSQIYNYGKRLFMEFIVPEPSAFYRHAQTKLLGAGLTVSPPVPLDEDFSFLDLKPDKYQAWVDLYQVPDVAPPPQQYQTVAKVVEVPEQVHARKDSDYVLMTKTDSIVVPEGYHAVEGWVYGSWNIWDSSVDTLHVHVGRRIFDKDKTNNDDYKELNEEEGVLPIGIYCYEIAATLISVEVRCKRKTETLRQWQLETYQKIVDTYNSQKSAYEAHLASVQNVQNLGLNDLHPDKKRRIEQDELQKGSLVLLTNQHFAAMDAIVPDAAPYGYPELDVGEAMEEGRYAQFMQQCFEWLNMTYTFYPYIWGRKSEWIDSSSFTDSDHQFETFLKAGAARILVPVRPGYEKSLFYYLSTGDIWNGGEPPVIDDENYVAIVDEIAESQGVSLDDAVEYGDPWTYSVPTELVKLQEDSELPFWDVSSSAA